MKDLLEVKDNSNLLDYDDFVDKAWFYKEAEHRGCPELAYLGLKMAGEAGEIAEKIGKSYRGDTTLEDLAQKLLLELGDVLFYVAKCASMLDSDLNEVARLNKEKIQGRQSRGTLRGSGDDR